MIDRWILKKLQEWLAIARAPDACHLTILAGPELNTWTVRITPREQGKLRPTVRYPRTYWRDKLSPGAQKPSAPSALQEADQ